MDKVFTKRIRLFAEKVFTTSYACFSDGVYLYATHDYSVDNRAM